MVKFVEVDPTEFEFTQVGRRGRVSYPILKGFLETGKKLVMLDRTGMQQSMQSLTSSLNAYIKSHTLPVKMFTRHGEIYLMRLDLDDDGNIIPDWTPESSEASEGRIGFLRDAEPRPIDEDEVDRRFEIEKDQTTK